MNRLAIMSALALILSACGAPSGDERAEDSADQGEGAVFDSMVESLDDAREVDELSRRQKARMDAAIGQAEDGEAPEGC